MSVRWWFAPTWLLSVVTGLAFGLVMVTGRFVAGEREVGDLVIGGLISAVVYGLFMGTITANRNRDRLKVLDGLTRAEQETAIRAAQRGPVPADPQLRAAALRFARESPLVKRRSGRIEFGIGVLFVVIGAVVAYLADPIAWILIPAGVVLMVAPRWQRLRADRRLALLEGA